MDRHGEKETSMDRDRPKETDMDKERWRDTSRDSPIKTHTHIATDRQTWTERGRCRQTDVD